MEIRYEGVGKRFDSVTVLADFDLRVPDGEFLALLGPSGCGKTTALRIMAGLEQPTTGRVFLGERDITDVPPRGRDVAMVFQSYALYPHLKVRDNIAYPLRVRKVAQDRIREEVARVAESLGISALLERKPRQLSGGERQRVALARAIIRHPVAFLMDEPLSNLDAQLRIHMRTEIKRLQKELAVTTLYVTHDQLEAMTMADSVGILYQGRLQQLATPSQLYARPANTFVARFVGSPPMNILAGSVTDGIFHCAGASIRLGPTAPAGDVQMGFRPEGAAIVAQPETDDVPMRVYTVEPLGNEQIVTFMIGDSIIHVRVAAESTIAMGDACGLRIHPTSIHLFSPADGRRIDWAWS
jgi:multiple sugar transport system ATP-binding protein